jgi:hypothetical protein
MNSQDSFLFWKNLILICVFFIATPIALGTSLFSLTALTKTEKPQQGLIESTVHLMDKITSGAKVFASLPSSFPSISGEVLATDARAEIIRQYLIKYNSPLKPYANLIVETADKYDLDYRLLVAIAQQESNLCKKIPRGTFNCWGWGIHSKGTLGFNSFEEAIEIVSKGLKEEYLDKGYRTPEEIMAKYTPLSNGSWAFGVNKFMNEMQ